MVNNVLRPLYKEVYGESFDYQQFSDRRKMQKVVFLLEQMGVVIGHYGFFWYKHGPYSQALQDDMWTNRDSDEAIPIVYNGGTKDIVNNLKNIINNDDIGYDIPERVECLASLQFLRTQYYRVGCDDSLVVEELKKRKSHLNSDVDNYKLLEYVKDNCISM